MTDNDHLSWRDAARFYWHIRRHPGHVKSIYYAESTKLVCCGCGKTWGAR